MRRSIPVDVLVIVRPADRNRNSRLRIIQTPSAAVAEVNILVMRIKHMIERYGHNAACNAYIAVRQHQVPVVVIHGYRTCPAYALAMIGPCILKAGRIHIYDRSIRMRTVIILRIHGVVFHIAPRFVICLDHAAIVGRSVIPLLHEARNIPCVERAGQHGIGYAFNFRCVIRCAVVPYKGRARPVFRDTVHIKPEVIGGV